MSVILGEHDKHIKDPVWVCVQKALEKRLKDLEAKGPSAELELSKKRYTGLTYKDVSIEPATLVKDGEVVVCIAVRKTGFARVDIAIEKCTIKDVFDVFNISYKTTETEEQFFQLVDDLTAAEGNLVYRKDTDEMVIVLKNIENIKKDVLNLLNDIFFNKITWDEYPELQDKFSGVVTLIDPSIPDTALKVASQKDINDAKNKYTLETKVVSLADGKMTTNIYARDADGNKVTPTSWEIQNPTESSNMENIETTHEVIEDGKCLSASWVYNADASIDRMFMVKGELSVDGEKHIYEVTYSASKVERKTTNFKQLDRHHVEITFTFDPSLGTVSSIGRYCFKGEGILEMDSGYVLKVESIDPATLKINGPYGYIPDVPAERSFSGRFILVNEMNRQVKYDTYKDPIWIYSLLPPEEKEQPEITYIKSEFDEETSVVHCEVECIFKSNGAGVVDPKIEIETLVDGKVVDYEITNEQMVDDKIYKFDVESPDFENKDVELTIVAKYSFPEYIGIADQTVSAEVEVKQPHEHLLEVNASDLKLGVLTVTGTLEGADPESWSYSNIKAKGFDLEPIDTKVDGNAYTLRFQLDPKAPTDSNISGAITNGDQTVEFTKDITRSPVFFNQHYGSNLTPSLAAVNFGFSDDGVNPSNLINGDVAKVYYTEDGVQKEFIGAAYKGRVTGSTTYQIRFDVPTFKEFTEGTMKVWVDDITVPNSSVYTNAFFSCYMPVPEGATGILAIPESLEKTDVPNQYAGKIKFVFNDEKRTPINKPYVEGDVRVNGEVWNSSNIKASEGGYLLTLNKADDLEVETITVQGQGSASEYIGNPSVKFEQRYGWKGGKGVVSNWGRMEYSSALGNLRLIDENGNSVYVNKWETKSIEPGVWSTNNIVNGTNDLYGVCTLRMSSSGLGVPNKATTTMVLLADGVEYTVSDEFDYVPVDVGEVTAAYDRENDNAILTVKLPADGIDSSKLIVQRDYEYVGKDGPNTHNWIRDAAIVDEKTVTFTCRVYGKDDTNYTIWFANADEKFSSKSVNVSLIVPKE